ncbi:hypothetical protein B0T22DRAFT_488923 [Podospora appendiculata]|uniref:Uncharacterized protein n=1 Tax=Podospora appendiculata TaxID=314037 RepID=A0AAE0XLH9_9PEZI|nr:hypothetical protein B0T22DRAFT_488923 [Podospora appendiculata]
MAILSVNPRFGRIIVVVPFALALAFLLFFSYTNYGNDAAFLKSLPIIHGNAPKPSEPPPPPPTHTPIVYKPTPTWTPPAITDPFPLLALSTAKPPPIPAYNVPREHMHDEYGLKQPLPLFIGFTRQWPILLQAVVSYITAGWPAEHIYVVENTGVHNKNREGKLSLQNQFFLNHTTLERLGVRVIQTPVLLTFAQLQNFFLSVAYQRNFPHYLYSHQDVLVFSPEDGRDTYNRPANRGYDFYDEKEKEELMNPQKAGQPGYRTIYENCLRELQVVTKRGEKWGFRWFQYDHLTMVNREAVEAVGGWDPFIPYYSSDCDINGKLAMGGWTMKSRHVGLINDISSTLTDLEVLYRNPRLTPNFTDPNPFSPEQEAEFAERMAKMAAEEKAKAEEEATAKKQAQEKEERGAPATAEKRVTDTDRDGQMPTDPLAYFRILNKVGVDMGWYKYREFDYHRNTWQKSQRGGLGEPYYYDPNGFARAFEIFTGAGQEIYKEKWGHRDCDLQKTDLKMEDQWLVEKDWEKKEVEEGEKKD